MKRFLTDHAFREAVRAFDDPLSLMTQMPHRNALISYHVVLLIENKRLKGEMSKEEEKELLAQHGLNECSPLFVLQAFRKSIFWRLALCWLHVELQGVWKSHVQVALATLSQAQLNGML